MNHEWAAGLFEGEGYIRQFNPNHITYEVKIKMTDYDVLQRMQSLYGGYLGPTMKAKPHYKDIFEWALTSKSAVKEFLLNILPHLGLRRTYLAQNLLDAIDKTHTHFI